MPNKLWPFLVLVAVVATAHTDPAGRRLSRMSRLVGADLHRQHQIGAYRYFVVQGVDEDGRDLTTSPANLSTPVDIPGFAGAPKIEYPFSIMIWVHNWGPHNVKKRMLHEQSIEVYDRGDGSWLVRFAPTYSCDRMTVSVRVRREHIVGSPAILAGPAGEPKWVRGLDCVCPVRRARWVQTQCDAGGATDEELVRQNFAKMIASQPGGLITRASIDDALAKLESGAARGVFVHYVIRQNRVFRRTFGRSVGFKMFSDMALMSLARRVRLPDVELLINLGDWPQAKQGRGLLPGAPVVSWCGSTDSTDAVLPTYIQMQNVHHAASEDHQRVDGTAYAAGTGWERKVPSLFWRGRDSNSRRLEFVRKAIAFRNRSHNANATTDPRFDVDAAITHFMFHRHPAVQEELGKAERVNQYQEYQRHRYLLNIDGTVAAYRLAMLLAGDSVVLLQKSQYYEHFYPELKPWVHFIPLHANLSNWEQMMDWAVRHDDTARRIARNARQYVRDRLSAGDILCYHVKALEHYAAHQDFTPEVRDDMVEVVHEAKDLRLFNASRHACACNEAMHVEEEEQEDFDSSLCPHGTTAVSEDGETVCLDPELLL